MTDEDIWEVYINSYIVDANRNVWAGPNAISLPMATPIHIITANNPHESRLTDRENTVRNQQLSKQLCSLDVDFQNVIGTSADGIWQEDSFAVSGLNRIQVCELARSYHQRGIFELTDSELMVIDSHFMNVRKKRPRLIT